VNRTLTKVLPNRIPAQGALGLDITAEVVIFTIRQNELQVLLVPADHHSQRGLWMLPGGVVGWEDDLDTCASRALAAQAGVHGVYLEQLYTFGDPDRCPDRRVIAVSYYALIPIHRAHFGGPKGDRHIDWFSVANLPTLVLDHATIVELARERLVAKLDYSTIAFQFLPESFTLSELQSVYEIILGEQLDKRNFRKRVLALKCLQQTAELRRNGSHRPARLYQLCTPGKVEYIK